MKKGRAALVVHDVVNVFLNATDAALANALPKIVELAVAARKVGVPVILLAPGKNDPGIGPDPRSPESNWGTNGVEVYDKLGPMPGDTIIRKPRWGGFYGTNLAQHLRAIGRDTVIICGISLAGGVDTTVRDAYNYDFHPITVADACRCRAIKDLGWGAYTSEEAAKVVLSTLAIFGDVVQTAELIPKLAEFA